jgi:hypothetical protein
MADYYDDKPTIIRKSRVSSKDARSTSAVNRAMATGNVEIHKKIKPNVVVMFIVKRMTISICVIIVEYQPHFTTF